LHPSNFFCGRRNGRALCPVQQDHCGGSALPSCLLTDGKIGKFLSVRPIFSIALAKKNRTDAKNGSVFCMFV
jgi:hypothetical protein